ncbi:hypothetical protein GCM10023189_34080 [Nibrella saemangeumensis]|uniref:Uncharacterized protein n=2 Tax=Nibrella saemangeumensis TaxID=1084526 RepID=A0ABP8N1T2_9BACT
MACGNYEDKLPTPTIQNGAHFVARPDPMPTAVTAANITTLPIALTTAQGATMSFTTESLNANEIEKVDAYVSHVRSTTETPAATAPITGRTLVKTITTFGGKEQIPVSELIAKSGRTTATLQANDRLRVRFVATMKDGRVFSWLNSGPAIINNPLGTTFTPLLDVVLQ